MGKGGFGSRHPSGEALNQPRAAGSLPFLRGPGTLKAPSSLAPDPRAGQWFLALLVPRGDSCSKGSPPCSGVMGSGWPYPT